MEAENPPTIVESRRCRTDKKLVAFLIERGMRLIEPMAPHVLFWISIKSSDYAWWMYENYDGQRVCNWLKHPLNLHSNNSKNRLMEQLNQLIAYCEPNSYVLKVAYLGRALMAYESKEDFYCMYNIWDAEEIDAILNFPNESTKREFDELYDRAHSRRLGNRYPSPYNDRSNCINYVVCNNSPRYGRYLHGKWNVMKGNLVLRELPFVRLLLSGDRWMRCHHCLIYAPLVLIPCRGCSIMLYCSKSCRDRAKQEYHSFECPIIFMLLSQYTPIEVLALRSTICAYKKFYEMPGVLENFIRSVCMSEKWVHQYCTPNGRYKNPEDAYGKVYQLATNRSRLTREKLTTDGLRGVALAKLLVRANNIPTSNVELLAELTVRHMHILRVNALVLHCSVDDPAKDCFDDRSVPYALALVTTGSMFNHSCTPNVDYSLSTDGTIEFRANRNIPWGKQMRINYRRNPRDDRYFFESHCLECRLYARTPSDVPSSATE